ncbi:hypothetical protein JVT61DRAFT_13424 [Boletus reticuloceps]|uniref:Uncharacterized protein n=1 Tax=Boletus reticuloceps TaxID=495285 RepID=A0A8I3A2S8_9AGAM|nr:hypothetical protein JVT61DRAFT_13424 [Boletus reticuloceps]
MRTITVSDPELNLLLELFSSAKPTPLSTALQERLARIAFDATPTSGSNCCVAPRPVKMAEREAAAAAEQDVDMEISEAEEDMDMELSEAEEDVDMELSETEEEEDDDDDDDSHQPSPAQRADWYHRSGSLCHREAEEEEDEEGEDSDRPGPAQRVDRRYRRSRPPCHRNGLPLPPPPVPRWNSRHYVGQSATRSASALLATLALPRFDSELNPGDWTESVRAALKVYNISKDPNISQSAHDLPAIVWRCHSLRSKEVGIEFLVMLSYIQLAFEVERICSETIPHTTVDKLFDARVSCLAFAPKKRTFTEWVSMGKKYVRLATGGSIYILVLLSGLQLRRDVTKASHKTLTTVSEHLIKPQLANQGDRNLIEQNIIPTVAQMRQWLPLKLEIPGHGELDCTDLEQMDDVFGQLKMKALKLPMRSKSAWQACQQVIEDRSLEVFASNQVLLDLALPSASISLSNPSAAPSPAQFASALPKLDDDLDFPVTKIITTYDPMALTNMNNVKLRAKEWLHRM